MNKSVEWSLFLALICCSLSLIDCTMLRMKRSTCDDSMDLTVHPNDCNKFYRCSNGYLYTLNCPKGTVFDSKKRYCNYANAMSGECGLLDRTCDSSLDLTRVPGDCSKFYRCSNNLLYTQTCPEDTVFDNKYKVCNFRFNVDDECGLSTPTCASLDFTSHPTDCQRFYRCANNNLYTFLCPPRTVFDNDLKICNYPSNVRGPCGTADTTTSTIYYKKQ